MALNRYPKSGNGAPWSSPGCTAAVHRLSRACSRCWASACRGLRSGRARATSWDIGVSQRSFVPSTTSCCRRWEARGTTWHLSHPPGSIPRPRRSSGSGSSMRSRASTQTLARSFSRIRGSAVSFRSGFGRWTSSARGPRSCFRSATRSRLRPRSAPATDSPTPKASCSGCATCSTPSATPDAAHGPSSRTTISCGTAAGQPRPLRSRSTYPRPVAGSRRPTTSSVSFPPASDTTTSTSSSSAPARKWWLGSRNRTTCSWQQQARNRPRIHHGSTRSQPRWPKPTSPTDPCWRRRSFARRI